MTHQSRDQAQSSAALWPGGPIATPADGAVAQDQPGRDAALAEAPPASMALLQRGRERFGIYCEPCHGPDGAGQGEIVRRGFPQPPSFGPGDADARHTVDVITHGYGVMYAFSDRIEPADRWAIAAYVKALVNARRGAGS